MRTYILKNELELQICVIGGGVTGGGGDILKMVYVW